MIGFPTNNWRNCLLAQFIDSGCFGVLIWHVPVMDGGAFYYTSEAAAIIAAYEKTFRNGRRSDKSVHVSGIPAAHWAAFDYHNRRLLVFLNFSDQAARLHIEQPKLRGQWQVNQYGKAEPATITPAKFEMTMEPYGTTLLIFTKR